MKHFYTVPTTLLAATPPSGTWHGIPAPGVPAVSLVIVEQWNSHAEQDAWEALPSVAEHHIENWGAIAPAAVIAAFAPWGMTAGMTLRQIFQLIRARWPICRP